MARTSRSYSLERGAPPRLVLTWEGSFRDVQVICDGVTIATLEPGQVTKGGGKVTLPDGTTIDVRMRGLLGLEVLREGTPLPGSDLDPRRVLRNGGILLAALSVVDTVADVLRVTHGAPLPTMAVPLALDAVVLGAAAGTFGGVRWVLAAGVAAFVARFGFEPSRSTWTLLFGLIATWVLATHFFAAAPRRAGRG